MSKNKRFRSLAAALLCAAILLLEPLHPLTAYASVDDVDEPDITDAEQQDDTEEEAVQTSGAGTNYEAQINDITKKLNDLKAAKAKIEQNINSAKTEKEKAQAAKNYIDQQIYSTKEEIQLLQDRIALLEENIADKQTDIETKQADIDQKYALFKKRLRAMDMNSDASLLGLILGAGSFVDFLTKTDTVVRVADHDRKLMEDLTQERISLEEDKATLQDTKEQVEADREETESKKQELGVQQQAASLKVQDMEEMEKKFKADLEKNKAMSAAMQTELANIYQQIEWSKNPYVGGEMLWPVPGYYTISSPYGWRFSGTDFHTGMDITGSGVYGKSIVAANDGTVKKVNWNYVPGVNYGIYLIIDHGGKYSTLYAHCSNIVVSEGDVVKRGQKIAEVGSTGWSTGPHLHFEVRIDGKHQNPLPYVQGNK